MTFLPGTGCHRVQFIYFFRGQIGPRTRSGIGLGSDSRLRRMRRCLVLPRKLWIEIFGKTWSRAVERKGPCLYVCTDGSGRACGVSDYPCLVPTPSDLERPPGADLPPKKVASWTRWRLVPVKNVNYPRPPSGRRSGLVGPYTAPPIVNYKYMTSTRREGYFGLPTLGT